MKLTPTEFNELLARPSVAARNLDLLEVQGAVHAPKPERAIREKPLAAGEREKESPSRVAVRIESRRSRLIDPDNLCPKYLIDGLRYSGLLQDDNPEQITLEVTQTKVKKGEEETIIELTRVPLLPNPAQKSNGL